MDFENGGKMCTTASLCMGMAIISGKMDAECQSRDEFAREMDGVMEISSRAHERMSKRLTGGASTSVCTGIQEVLDCAGINLKELGLSGSSYIVSPRAGDPTFYLTDGKGLSLHANCGSKGSSSSLLYSPAQDLVTSDVVPELLLTRGPASHGAVAVLTCSGHSVLLVNSPGIGGYGHFDPLYGKMVVGLDRGSLMQFVAGQTLGQEISDLYIISRRPG